MIRFLYNSWFDSAALTLQSGVVQTGWPLANLQDTIRRKVMKTDGTGNLVIRMEADTPTFCGGLALVEHDLAADTVVTVRAYEDAAYSSLVLEQSEQAIGPIIPWGEAAWGGFVWGGLPTEADLAIYPRIASLLWFPRVATLYWEVEIANGSAEFYLGRILLGDYWQPTYNFSRGYTIEDVDPSKEDESLAQVIFTDRKAHYFRVVFDLEVLSEVECFDQFLKMVRRVGTSQDLVIQVMDHNAKAARLTTIYGRFRGKLAFTGRGLDLARSSLEFREAL